MSQRTFQKTIGQKSCSAGPCVEGGPRPPPFSEETMLSAPLFLDNEGGPSPPLFLETEMPISFVGLPLGLIHHFCNIGCEGGKFNP